MGFFLFNFCLVLLCSCSSTTQQRDWGQVWEVWTISNPTPFLPQWSGPNRLTPLWKAESLVVKKNWLFSVNFLLTEHTNTNTVN